jgi:hypothetical protein
MRAAPVHIHVATAGKFLLAKVTLVRPCPCVDIGVLLEDRLGGKPFATIFALEGLGVVFSMKNGHVRLQAGLGD